jgi:asparagine synthase (glutamine-hydrolysing)
MRLQAGVLYRDERAATSNDLTMILEELDRRKAEIAGQVLDGPLAMVYRADRITHEEDYEIQPFVSSACTLTWDGRLDNREDLGARMGLTSVSEIPDPSLVSMAYTWFGDAIFPELIGEFALTLWSQRLKELVFARSVCGARPLYYLQDKNRIVWSSDFAHLVRTAKVDLEVNEAYLLEYLVSQPSVKRTPLIHVHAVEPGTALRFANSVFQPVVKLWDPRRIKTLHFASDRQYEEDLRERLGEAVRLRMRARAGVFAELSGGLDSSSLVVTADAISRAAGTGAVRLKTVSCRYEESESCDEGYFIRQIEDNRGVVSFYIHEADQQVTLGLHDIRFTGLPSPLHCYPGRYAAYASIMHEHHAHILLTGEGGDHLFWSILDGTPVVADALRNGNLWHAHQQCTTWSRVTGIPYVRLLLRQAIPLAFGPIFGWAGQYQPPALPAWLSQSWKNRFHETVWDAVAPEQNTGRPAFRAHLRQVEALFCQLSAGYVSEHHDIYVSHPYAHRPLVEFCLSLPISQHLRDAETRSLMRRALANRLPSRVLRRKSKGSLEEPLTRAINREFSIIGRLSDWQLCQRGIADPEMLGKAIHVTKLGLQSPTSGNFIRVFSLERWLRSLSHIHETKRGRMERPVAV